MKFLSWTRQEYYSYYAIKYIIIMYTVYEIIGNVMKIGIENFFDFLNM